MYKKTNKRRDINEKASNLYLGSIEYANGIIPTPYGDIKVEWEKQKDGSLKYNIQKPIQIKIV